MSTTLQIRRADISDAAYISLLGRITFGETFGHLFSDKQDLLDYFEKTFSVDKIERGLQKSENLFWLAFVDRLPVGYAKLKLNSKSAFWEGDSICQLQKIYVLKDFLSMKIGFKLQQILLQEAKDLGFEKTWLSVLDSNKRAIAFYVKNGFSNVGTHGFDIGKESFNFYVMLKDLSN
ncbi:MAG: GNAT family N-acetyltransferase [Bacteroidia bacterium]|nr:GNAT family N-acetyltransferase [Bacteroidia bacterium]